MRRFEVTLTYKLGTIETYSLKDVIIRHQRVLAVELDDESCISPEQFCDNVINVRERPDIIRINIKEDQSFNNKPLYWLSEQLGRIYFYNGIPIVFHRN